MLNLVCSISQEIANTPASDSKLLVFFLPTYFFPTASYNADRNGFPLTNSTSKIPGYDSSMAIYSF